MCKYTYRCMFPILCMQPSRTEAACPTLTSTHPRPSASCIASPPGATARSRRSRCSRRTARDFLHWSWSRRCAFWSQPGEERSIVGPSQWYLSSLSSGYEIYGSDLFHHEFLNLLWMWMNIPCILLRGKPIISYPVVMSEWFGARGTHLPIYSQLIWRPLGAT